MNTTTQVLSHKKTLTLVYIALFAVLTAICSWISIPLTVPFTLQTFAIFFVIAVLGAKNAFFSILIWILLGAVGVPVFANFSSGIGVLFGTTGGYILGFLMAPVIYYLFTHFLGEKTWVVVLSMVVGLIACYAFGTIWFIIVYANAKGPVGIMTSLSWCVFPFVIPDLIKIALAIILSKKIKPLLSQH